MLAVGLKKNETNPSRKKNGPHGQKLGDIARNIFGFLPHIPNRAV
jgi:hypothetical protein